ncbi:MAG: hypothetical protein H7070_09025, partial [Saprospiraceae bacterium]|nr:hypothetical protein [Pyrinomonadaceae bacterium]
MKTILLTSLFLLAFCLPALGQQKMYEPKSGSAERTALINAMRDHDLKKNPDISDETFVASGLKVQSGWAYANVEQKTSSGQLVYGQAHVFLQKTGNVWKVVFSTFNDKNEVGVDGLERLK